MTNKKIKQILISEGVTYLYHADSVETSLSFLKNGGLISRGICEDNNFPQSPQSSDYKDKCLGIYYDIFFDSVDIHMRSKQANYYGPVLFIYDIDVLDEIEEGAIKITKDNPIRWKINSTNDKRYFTEVDDLHMNFHKGNFGQHITIVNRQTPLPFDFLSEIILNFPENFDCPLIHKASIQIQEVIQEKNIPTYYHEEICYNNNCKCHEFYSKKHNTEKFFGLGNHHA